MTSQDKTLRERLQCKCVEMEAYWRASDSHGVILSVEQATELLVDALGVEVEIEALAAALAPAAEAVAEIKWAGPIPQKVLEWKDGVNRFITDNPIGTRIYTTPQPTPAAEAVECHVCDGEGHTPDSNACEYCDGNGVIDTTPQPAPVVDAGLFKAAQGAHALLGIMFGGRTGEVPISATWDSPLAPIKVGEIFAALTAALAPKPTSDFCDGHCTWLDHHPDCPRSPTSDAGEG